MIKRNLKKYKESERNRSIFCPLFFSSLAEFSLNFLFIFSRTLKIGKKFMETFKRKNNNWEKNLVKNALNFYSLYLLFLNSLFVVELKNYPNFRRLLFYFIFLKFRYRENQFIKVNLQ